ncbi:rod shape-determining protein MreC [Nocardioides taihuensis]|uniref:Cell shape-determining protein MreC n=1 Tax=Nocardioides taihuensis TaxID=1835606 RepID=A0ABW0BRP4_9ACTN
MPRLDPSRGPLGGLAGLGRSGRRERRWGGADGGQPGGRGLLVALVLASLCLMVIDRQGDDASPLEPARRAVGEVFGPVETGTTAALRPFLAVPDWFQTHDDLEQQVDELEAENARLRAREATTDYDRNRLAAYEGLTTAAGDLGYALVPARVVGVGPAQSFSQTVTIDAGSSAGVQPDMTVLDNDGLVGRVVRVTSSTATVLLIIDADSTVGGRLGSSMQLGFLHGRGTLGDDGRLDLELLDESVVPARNDTVVTWGSDGGAPYVSGVPVGKVTSVYSSVRESTQRAVIEPFVDFGSLDLVGVVVPSGTRSDRGVIEADGSLR